MVNTIQEGIGVNHINEQTEMFKTKTCRICEAEKPITDFYFRKDSNTYRTECRACQLRIVNKKRHIIGSKEHARIMLRDAVKRSKKKKTKVTLTKKDIQNMAVQHCPILGIKLIIGSQDWFNSPSLDRIDNNKGYTKDNVIMVSHMANSIKNQATPDQILKVGKFYKELYQEKGIVNG